jgi:DNA modification methylase
MAGHGADAMRVEHIGNATLYLGDCLDILPTLPKVDAVITDPPYGIGADKNLRANQQHGKAAAPSRDYGASEWDGAPPGADLLRLVVAAGKSAILWGGNYFVVEPSSCWLVWDKENGSNGYADCELAWTNLPKAVRRLKWRWAGMLQQDMGNKEERVHPTQKPVPVMVWCIEQAGDPATILDPFMGSGTTGVAAIQRGKAFTGIEREPKYFDIACRRIEQAQKQGALFKHEEPKAEQLTL